MPVGILQGAGFTGAATGVNLARDIENGLFDRFLASPAPTVGAARGTGPVGVRPRADAGARSCSSSRGRSAPTSPASTGC